MKVTPPQMQTAAEAGYRYRNASAQSSCLMVALPRCPGMRTMQLLKSGVHVSPLYA
jgi:hypothetical protein